MQEYLAFVDEIGRTIDGNYIYRFDFTVDTEIVWGDFFNVPPSGIIPNLQADVNTLSSRAKAVFPRRMTLAKKNYCFSMQDCIDGIIPLIFSEIDEETLVYKDSPFFIEFGTPYEEVENMLKEVGLSFFDYEKIEHGNNSGIDDLIDQIEITDNNDDDLD